jgi:hypothetical protein
MRKAGLLLLFLLLLFPADSETVEYLSMDSSGCVFSFTNTPSF